MHRLGPEIICNALNRCLNEEPRCPPKSRRRRDAGADRPVGVRAPRARRPKPLSVHEIHDRILTAISEHRLPPGTQLVEEKLAACSA